MGKNKSISKKPSNARRRKEVATNAAVARWGVRRDYRVVLMSTLVEVVRIRAASKNEAAQLVLGGRARTKLVERQKTGQVVAAVKVEAAS